MAHTDVFTDRTPGEAFSSDENVVELCPRCGRPGVERETEDGRVCVHAETTEIHSDGLLTVPVESCPLGPLPFAVNHPEVI